MDKETERELNAKAHAGVIISNGNGQILLVQSSELGKDGTWSLPAGTVEPGESPLDTAPREAEEEVGTKVRLKSLVGIYYGPRSEGYTGVGAVFAAEIIEGEPVPNPADNKVACKYFSFEEITVLLEAGKLYRPEYNLTSIQDFFDGKLYPLEVIKLVKPYHERNS